jgi:hypothetical protein
MYMGLGRPRTRALRDRADWQVRPLRCLPAALSQFQALDADGNGVIDKREFASILNMDPDCERTTYMFNALDVDRNGQVSVRALSASVCTR